MVAGCGHSCIKYLLITFNTLVFAAGVVTIAVFLYGYLNAEAQEVFQNFIDKADIGVDLSKYSVAIWVMVAIGAFLCLVGFLGCCGASWENRCCLGLYVVIVSILFFAEIAVLVAAFVFKDEFRDEIERALVEAKQKDPAYLYPIEDLFDCCSVYGEQSDNCKKENVGVGCVEAIWKVINFDVKIGSIIIAVIMVLEVAALIFTCVLCEASSRHRYYYD